MRIFFIFIGLYGFIFSMVFLLAFAIIKKPKKKVGIALGVFAVMFIIGLSIPSTTTSITEHIEKNRPVREHWSVGRNAVT